MKNSTKVIIGTVALIAILVVVYMIGRNTAPASAAVSAESYPEKAVQLGKWIDEGSKSYEAAKAEKESYEAQAKEAGDRMAKSALSNSGLRMTLCNDFRFKREKGEFIALADDVECTIVGSFR